jgi:hypothetical protein
VLTGGALAVLAGIAISLAGAKTVSTGVVCPPDAQQCFVEVETPGTSASAPDQTGPVATGGARVCSIKLTGETVACFDPDFGWFNSQDENYFKLQDPQPPSTDPVWEGTSLTARSTSSPVGCP